MCLNWSFGISIECLKESEERIHIDGGIIGICYALDKL